MALASRNPAGFSPQQFRASSIDQDDGAVHLWIDCTHWIDRPNFCTRSAAHPTTWHSIWFGDYLAHTASGNCLASSEPSYTYWDDVYVDFTQARVEIGNAPSWNASTHREIQIPHTTWNDNTIQFTVNLGSFNSSEQLYLFVVNADGSVSAGYPLEMYQDIPTIISVNDTLEQGKNITITGRGFGTKAHASPAVWDDFESGAAGETLDGHGGWMKLASSGSTVGARYNGSVAYSGSKSAHNEVYAGSGVDTSFDTNYHMYPPSEEVYLSYLYKYDVTGDCYGVMKQTRLNSNESANGNHYNGPGDTGRGASLSSLANGNAEVYWNSGNAAYQANGGGTDVGVWQRIEMYKKLSTPGLLDGIVQSSWKNNVTYLNGSADTRSSGFNFQMDSVLLGLMLANPRNDGRFQMYIDDIYVDSTRSRVEIGNAADWSGSTKREIQIPTSWTDNEISFTTNLGSFDGSEQLYLFVVNADNNASAGYPVSASIDSLCGNGAVNDGEECDGEILGGNSCLDLGFDGGTYSCNPPGSLQECKFDVSLCTPAGSVVVDDLDYDNVRSPYGSNYWYKQCDSRAFGNTYTYANYGGGWSFAWFELFTPLSSGTYRVDARWFNVANVSAQFLIRHSQGNTTVMVNQSQNEGTWQSLGTYNFTAEGAVRLLNGGVASRSIDAVRFVPVSNNNSTCPSHDTNQDNRIDANELMTALNDWLAGRLSLPSLMELMGYFKRGSCI